MALELGLPFGERTMTYNSRLAQELGLWAEDRGKGDDFHKAAFHCYFSEGRNLAQSSVLTMLAEQVKLPKNEAISVLSERTYKEKVDRDWSDAKLKGITAVPTFIVGHHKLVGMQSYETLARFVEMLGVSKKGDDNNENS